MKKIKERIGEFTGGCQYTEKPDFPRVIMFEATNACNHKCVFCSQNLMTRPVGYLNLDVFADIARQAFDLGARDCGLHTDGEPLMNKNLHLYVGKLKEIGYPYVFITTNGALASPQRASVLLDAGLDSIKFSVNGGDRRSYAEIHGRDDFDLVCRNVEFVDRYRKEKCLEVYLSISFVETPENAPTYGLLEERFGSIVDEIYRIKAFNQSGQMSQLPSKFVAKQAESDADAGYIREKFEYPDEACPRPFNAMHVSKEGYLRACCNDYQNMLAIDDLNAMTLAEAWHGERFREFRRRHLDHRCEGTLCFNCIHGTNEPVAPVNPSLSDLPAIGGTRAVNAEDPRSAQPTMEKP
ncbi:MAG: radical SAM protein [Candidatus Competibacteraceae bacterium]|nr:radical SAM protein [Candidatus Competibacteraceae bacterium]